MSTPSTLAIPRTRTRRRGTVAAIAATVAVMISLTLPAAPASAHRPCSIPYPWFDAGPWAVNEHMDWPLGGGVWAMWAYRYSYGGGSWLYYYGYRIGVDYKRVYLGKVWCP